MSLDRVWHGQQCQTYKSEFPAYKIYASVLNDILQAVCRLHAPLAIVQSRAKTFSSFAEKVARKADKYRALGLQPTDLCGARVITETEAEFNRICKVIREVFTIDEANSLDVRTRLHATEFGYLSVHYTVQLSGTQILGVPIPPEIGERKAEIQVRTLLQHAWASISHDRIYKSSFQVPSPLKRELARVAAFLEEADQQFGGVVEALDEYKPHYGVYMTKEQLAQEVDVLETVLASEPDATKRPAGALRLAQVSHATGEWPRVIDLLNPYLETSQSCQAEVLAEHGHALCRLHHAESGGILFQQGYGELARAADLAVGAVRARVLAYRAWASARIPDNELVARDHYRAAYEADRKNPFHLACFVEHEISCGEPLGFRAIMRPVFEQAIRTCRAHAEAGIELPWAFFAMGRFHLLLDETYESLAAYAKAIRLCLSGASCVPDAALDDEVAFIRRIHRARSIPEEHNWVLQLLLLAKRVRSGATPAGLAAKRKEFTRPVVILAGGTAASCQSVIEGFRGSVLRALEGFRGTVISGGTRAGVAGLAGEVGAEVIGYLPRNLPYDQQKDDRYTALVPSDGAGYGAGDALQYWTDLLLAGVRPADVRVLGIDGGRIAAFEYRLALALGAPVGILEPATRATAALKEDCDWVADPNLIRLPNDPMTLRAFLTTPSPALSSEEVDALARRIHENFLAKDRYKSLDPVMKPWDELKEDLRGSNRSQAIRAAGFLERIGYRVEHSNDPINPAKLMAEEVEALAEMEHGRWVVERLRSGWRYDSKRDPAKKLSPYLVGWTHLSEEVKEYDRDAVQVWPALLAEAGFALNR
jgi:ppGpp synthetase/RelA/SpoT-type nucleotidyltranferase